MRAILGLVGVVLTLVLAGGAFAEEEDCCVGTCWMTGCCPGMRRCGTPPPQPSCPRRCIVLNEQCYCPWSGSLNVTSEAD